MEAHTDANPFPATRWSLVIESRAQKTAIRERALEELCRAYWTPLYAYARRLGHKTVDAEDLTQGFLALMLTKDDFGRAQRQLGKFRSYMRTAFRNFVTDHHKSAKAIKRGGDAIVFSIDAAVGENRYREYAGNEMTPEMLFDQHFAIALLQRSLVRLKEAFEKSGRAEQFATMKPFLDQGNGGCPSYAEVALVMGISEAATKSAIHRFRGQYRDFVLKEVEDTLGHGGDVEAELRYLLSLFS